MMIGSVVVMWCGVDKCRTGEAYWDAADGGLYTFSEITWTATLIRQRLGQAASRL